MSFVVAAVSLILGIFIYSEVSDGLGQSFGDPILISNGTGGETSIATTNLYTCDNPNNGGNQIHLIDESDGTIISSQNIVVTLSGGSMVGCLGLAVDPTDAQMYAIIKDDGTPLRYLVAIDPTTGVGTEIADFTAELPIVTYGGTVDYQAKTINFDSSGQLYTTESVISPHVLDKVDKTTGIAETENPYCVFDGYQGNYVFPVLNYDTGDMFYIDGDDRELWYGTIDTAGVGGSCGSQSQADGFTHTIGEQIYPPDPHNFQMGMAYDTVTGEYFIQDSYEEPQTISRMTGSGVSSKVGNAIPDDLQRGMAFAIDLIESGGSPVYESQTPEAFTRADAIAFTILAIIPITLFFALFTLFSPRVDGEI